MTLATQRESEMLNHTAYVEAEGNHDRLERIEDGGQATSLYPRIGIAVASYGTCRSFHQHAIAQH